MAADSSVSTELRERIDRGDESALLELFTSHRERLKRMVKLRLDRRLKGRLDASDVLQEACIDVARRAREYVASPSMPVFLWLRFITGQRLVTLHRKHLGSKARDAGLEVSLYHGALPLRARRSPCSSPQIMGTKGSTARSRTSPRSSDPFVSRTGFADPSVIRQIARAGETNNASKQQPPL